MKKIQNPYTRFKSYHCFGCAPDNKIGLKLEFYEFGDTIQATWIPTHDFEGYMNVLHGGIQVTLMDEIAGWVVNTKAGTGGVTANLEARFIKPLFIDKGQITLKAKLIQINRRFAEVSAEIWDASEVKCAEAKINYFLFEEEKAKEQLRYTGKDSFYQE